MKTLLVTILLLLVISVSSTASVVHYQDPLGWYQLAVPGKWVPQVRESNDQLMIFYGANESDLFYVEHLGPLRDEDVKQFAQRVLAQYQSPSGPKNFEIIEDIYLRELDDMTVAATSYTYQGEHGKIQELRLFVLNNGIGFSIAFSDQVASFAMGRDQFEQILADWKWVIR